ncbi:unnamed protein product [Brassica napus]|uniref:(rape) hypothetical protein n=1 Tax=Brassica napus TaxID=3708 RepID=A0A816L920_BRANA|nr:unnamed protein product [Brassica napus]
MSHNVENLSLDFWSPCNDEAYTLPDFFYNSSSVKQLNVSLSYSHTIVPQCTVSYPCTLFDESMAKILSGCPVLENLTLYHCDKLKVLDLRKSHRLRTLQIRRNVWVPGPTQIVAPHIHFLRLLNSQLSCIFFNGS